VTGAWLVVVLACALVSVATACVSEREQPGPVSGPPVASTGDASASATATATATPPATTRPRPARYVYPVAGRTSYGRTHHDYPATDIFAPCGTAVRAVTDAVVLEVSRVDRWDPQDDDGAERGGLFVSLLGDDGVRYYGAHLRTVRAGIEAGVRVGPGDPLGTVGDTGRASACHLHFGVSPPCARTGDWWIRRGVVYPWSYLDSWRAGGQASPVRAVSAWRADHGCPKSP
jgi:murein DD-endopeptidase MepM/ murein hydrolase activator NlpD